MHYIIPMTKDEEVLAGLLTRDAWTYFASFIARQELAQVKDIPLTPRRGVFEITTDPEVIQYYLCFADAYGEELEKEGWDAERYTVVSEAFIEKLERTSGLKRGEAASDIQNTGS
jgi:hypothetical protein